MIQEIQNGRSMLTTLAVYKEFDTASEGYLVWTNGEIRDFVVTCFERLALRPPADADVALFFEHFDPDRKLMLDVHECLCIVDAMLRSVFLGTETDVGAGHEALPTELTIKSVANVAASGTSAPLLIQTGQAGPATHLEFEPRARLLASSKVLSPGVSGGNAAVELSARSYSPEQSNSLASGITPALLQAQQAELARAALIPQDLVVRPAQQPGSPRSALSTVLQHSAQRLISGGGIAAPGPEGLRSGASYPGPASAVNSYPGPAPAVNSARSAAPAAVSAQAVDPSGRWATDPPGLRLLDPSRVLQRT